MTKKEVEKLRIGDIIYNKKDLKWTFIVSSTFTSHIIAVRTIQLTDLKDWEKLDKNLPEND